MKIWVDMDGVLVDYVANVAAHFNIPVDELYQRWPKGCYDMHHAVGIPDKELWDTVRKVDNTIWVTMPEYNWARDLWDTCLQMTAKDNTYICTSPIPSSGCYSGKFQWLSRFMNDEYFRKVCFLYDKFELARWNSILIDDKELNCELWEKEGGKAILFPAHWNRLHEYSADPWTYAKPILTKFAEEIKSAEAMR